MGMNVKITGFDTKKILSQVHDNIEKAVREAVRGVRCAEHGNAPTVQRNAEAEIGWSISGCCQPMIDEATELIHKKFS